MMILRVIAAVFGAALMASSVQAHIKPGCIRTMTPSTDRVLAQSAPGMIDLDQGPRVVQLAPICAAIGRAEGVLQRVASAPASRRFLLVIEDLRAGAQPGVLFDLELSSQAASRMAKITRGRQVGTLNFFAAQPPGVAARPRVVSYDVTTALRAMAADKRRSSTLVLTIRPANAPETASDAAIGRVVLIER